MKAAHLRMLLLVFAAACSTGAARAQQPTAEPKPAAEKPAAEAKPEVGMVEFGIRHIEGDVYGRPDLPFQPSLQTSKFNEYRDIRNGFFIRRFRLHQDGLLGSHNYLSLLSDKAIYRDQSYL